MTKPMNEYDEIKGMLNKIRKIQSTVNPNTYGLIKEQVTNDKESGIRNEFPGEVHPVKSLNIPPEDAEKIKDPEDVNVPDTGFDKQSENGSEKEDIAVINDVEVVIHSEDPEDLALDDEEKHNISQLIDEFRKEVSEVAEFDKLHVYSDSAKLDGKIGNMDLNFSFSTGDDTGVYLANTSMLKIDNESFDMINKLRTFQPKFSNTINDLLLNRSTT